MPTYRVTDTVTYARTWILEAIHEEAAIEAIENGDWAGINFSEEQIEASGYEAVPFAESELDDEDEGDESAEPFRCTACDRPELDCSADPCPAVVADRGEP